MSLNHDRDDVIVDVEEEEDRTWREDRESGGGQEDIPKLLTDDENDDEENKNRRKERGDRAQAMEDDNDDDVKDDRKDHERDKKTDETDEDAMQDPDSPLENLAQGCPDLEGRALAGVDLQATPCVRKQGLARYRNTFRTLLPVRAKGPKEILPISSLGCLNLVTFGWVTPIIFNVYRKGAEATLGAYRLDHRDTAEANVSRMEKLWRQEVDTRGANQASFTRVVLRAFRTRLIVALIFILIHVFLGLFSPIFLIPSFLDYLSGGRMEMGVGMGYVAGMFFSEVCKTLVVAVSWANNYRAGMQIRAGAMTLLYKKLLHLKGLQDKTVGELVNMATTDSQRIFDAISIGPLVISGPVAMIAGCAYAIYYLGPWALVGCGVFIGFYLFNTFISGLTTYFRSKSIVISDERIRMINELFSSVKLIKMYAWEKPFAQKIFAIRRKERSILEKSAMVQSISTGTAGMVTAIAAALTFIAMVSAGEDLTAAKAFSFVALLNSLKLVLAVLPYGIKILSEVRVALRRYTAVLLMEEMEPKVTESRPPSNLALEVKDITMAWSSVGDVTPSATEKKDPRGKVTPGKKNNRRKTGQKTGREKEAGERKMLGEDGQNATDERSSETVALRNVSFSLQKGKLLGVCGSVGSGKSSLIQAILGRMEKKSGSISVGGRVAYVPQQAWIMNTTVRDNILFGSSFDQQRYTRVVDACALQADFEILVDGDMTEIGERGITLSGGQKQRVSLARALYSDLDLYLLDDPLSAVDMHVGKHIFTHCVTGLLATKSAILVTHQLQYLPQCDDILFLKEGRIAERGLHDDLMERKGDYASLIHVYHTQLQATQGEEEEEVEVMGNTVETSTAITEPRALPGSEKGSGSGSDGDDATTTDQSADSTATDCHDQDMDTKTKDTDEGQKPATEEKDDDDDDNNEKTKVDKLSCCQLMKAGERKRDGAGMGVLLAYVRTAGETCSSVIVLFIFLLSVISQNSTVLFLSFWLGQGSGNISITEGNVTRISHSVTDHPRLWMFTLILGMTLVAMIVCLFIRAVSFMKLMLKASSVMHDDVFQKILRCPMSFFDTTPLGKIITRFSSDMDEVDVHLPMSLEMFVYNNLYLFCNLAFISYVGPWFLIFLVPLVIAFFIVFRIFSGSVRNIRRHDMVSRSPIVGHVTASVQGLTTIHAFCKAKEFLDKFCGMVNTNNIPFTMFYVTNRWLAIRLDLLGACVTGVTSFIIVQTYDHITPAMAGLALSSALQVASLQS